MALHPDQADKQERVPGRLLIAGAALCFVASGGLLWWRYGASVFNDLVLAGLALCF